MFVLNAIHKLDVLDLRKDFQFGLFIKQSCYSTPADKFYGAFWKCFSIRKMSSSDIVRAATTNR